MADGHGSGGRSPVPARGAPRGGRSAQGRRASEPGTDAGRADTEPSGDARSYAPVTHPRQGTVTADGERAPALPGDIKETP